MPRDIPDLEPLLAETGWVRSLARRLVADGATADDLAQDAWVAAIEHPPRNTSASRAWFARVLRNLSARRGTRETSRRAHERSAARAEEYRDDLVSRAEMSRRLVDAVIALDEPYRSTILAHYFD